VPYPQSRNDPASRPLAPSLDRCYLCDAEEYDMRRTPDGLQTVCSSCSRQCSWCGDWMGEAPGDMHPQCQEEAHADEAATDARADDDDSDSGHYSPYSRYSRHSH